MLRPETMHDSHRHLISEAETLVIKVGSRVLSGSDGRLDTVQVGKLAAQIVALMQRGKEVVLVSSGAVASGVGKLGLAARPTDLANLQAVAAVGQTHLIQAYERYFAEHSRHAAQILLIADDLDDRVRYLNVRNTLNALLALGVIPIINENDTVAVDELLTTFGDNDRLAAMVAGLFRKPALIILSDVEGVFDRNPSLSDARVLPTIRRVDKSIFDLAVSHNSKVSKGGMASKLRAAQFVTQSGAPVVIASGRVDNILVRVFDGEELGTIFLPQSRSLAPKKRWIGFSTQAAGYILVDSGAVRALGQKNSSLLAIGITSVEGSFEKGDIVSICDAERQEIARGLTNYSSSDLERIKGQQSDTIAETIGHCPYEEVVHRDNMTIVGISALPAAD